MSKYRNVKFVLIDADKKQLSLESKLPPVLDGEGPLFPRLVYFTRQKSQTVDPPIKAKQQQPQQDDSGDEDDDDDDGGGEQQEANQRDEVDKQNDEKVEEDDDDHIDLDKQDDDDDDSKSNDIKSKDKYDKDKQKQKEKEKRKKGERSKFSVKPLGDYLNYNQLVNSLILLLSSILKIPLIVIKKIDQCNHHY